ncbi:MAG TPA: IS1634 family transposase [Synechococcales cyanobacterium M55_K2018_004]|nr:IS1634 family transposase [Synechococcales cyanobacterium M55_K2018_004]
MQIENLDHLGLIAGVIDEIGLVELTNEELGTHKLQQISPGQVVKAMILNALGFISAPLYLFSEFFSGKPVEHLLGVGVRAEQLNDDRLGRVLDELFDYGTTTFFLKAAMQAAQRFEVKRQQFHLDSTSFALDGEYQSEAAEGAATGGEAEPTPIRICRGYSRDHRPELKQFLVNLVCSNDGGIPLWFQVGSGNETDSQTFAVIAKAFAEQWQVEGLMVMDAAFYSEPNLKQMGDIQWLTRVPQTLSAAQSLIESDETALLERPCSLKGYRLWEKTERYGGVEQRWILVESQQRRQSDPRWQASFLKQEKALQRQLKELCAQVFACRLDAMDALVRFEETLQWHTLSGVSVDAVFAKRAPGRPKRLPKSSDEAERLGYQIKATLERTDEFEQKSSQKRSRFILATNQLDAQQFPAERLLVEYKQQQMVERGFRFLKDPLFFTSSVFVKKPQRVEALALLMALTLLVYNLAQRKLRQQLQQADETILDQTQKPTATPTDIPQVDFKL